MMSIEEALRQFALNNAQNPNAPAWVKELAAQFSADNQSRKK